MTSGEPGRVTGPPVGRVTRGTTNPNRLRRVDRWLTTRHAGLLRSAADPLVVDLGYGRHPVTVVELATRLRRIRPDVEVVGVEIDPERVATARRSVGAAPGSAADVRVTFEHGGFDLAALGRRRPAVIRAFNVLRQYEVDEVGAAWAALGGRLAPGGVVLDGTCDEVGRVATWVVLDASGPRSLVLALRLGGLARPGVAAARLPKALIERNTPPYAVHDFLCVLDAEWERAVAVGAFGARQRFATTCAAVAQRGWPLRQPGLWRDGVVEVDWSAVTG